MPVITVGKETNLWDEICSEFAVKRAQAQAGAISTSFLNTERKYFENTEIKKPSTDKQIYDPSKHTPVFCNYSYDYVPIDDITQIQIDTRISHPACINYALKSIKDYERELTTKTISIPRLTTPIKKSKRTFNN